MSQDPLTPCVKLKFDTKSQPFILFNPMVHFLCSPNKLKLNACYHPLSIFFCKNHDTLSHAPNNILVCILIHLILS